MVRHFPTRLSDLKQCFAGWLNVGLMANLLLVKAKSMMLCDEGGSTPKKEVKVKELEDFTPTPVAKKNCTAFGKFLKRQEGDVSMLHDPWTKLFSCC